MVALARSLGLDVLQPDDPNAHEFVQLLRAANSDLFVLAGYGKILKRSAISVPRLMCINLHAGKLPEYRGSSPMNWALINGERSFTLSVIKLDTGVDSGDVLLERTFDIRPDYTIRDLHEIANRQFPDMMLEVVSRLESGDWLSVPQEPTEARYYPLRFPDDGLVIWDLHTAQQVHNRIRALTDPYPGAFTFYQRRKVKLLASELNEYDFYGEPGRVYRLNRRGLLTCAADKCLWITEARFEDTGQPLRAVLRRYEHLATLRGTLLDGAAAASR